MYSFWKFLIAWYNLPFTLMLGLSVALAGLQLLGLSHDGDADIDPDADIDGDMDADVNADIAIHHDLDHDMDHDIEHDTDHDSDVDNDSLSGFSWLAFIGIGKAPLMVVILIVLISTGLMGWFLNGLAVGMLGVFPGLLLLGTFLVSLVVGSLITSRITRFIGRALPPISTTATRAQSLVGKPGTVISPFVDTRYGMVHLRDDGGTLISLFAVTEDDQPIVRGTAVILLSYNAAQRLYLVTRQ